MTNSDTTNLRSRKKWTFLLYLKNENTKLSSEHLFRIEVHGVYTISEYINHSDAIYIGGSLLCNVYIGAFILQRVY